MSRRHFELVIVGAGVAGLAASVRATELGIDHVVLEAGNRIGGRLHTVIRRDGTVWDRGAHGLRQPPINPLVREAENRSWPFTREWHPYSGVWLNGNLLSENDSTDVWHQIDECEDLARDLVGTGEDAALLDLIDPTFVHVDAAAAVIAQTYGREGRSVSAVDVATFGSHEGDWPVDDGYGALIERIYADVPVLLNSAVRVVDWGADPVRVDLGDELIEAERVLLTASTGVLASGHIIFAPDLPELTTTAIEHLPMGSINKVILDVDRIDPQIEPGSAVYSVRDSESVYFKTPRAGNRALVATVAGEFGRMLEAGGPDEMIAVVADHALAVFGDGADVSIDHAESTAWGTDRWILGAQSVAMPGAGAARRNLSQPIEDRLYFAGEACSPRSFGTVHGARQSGIDAINRIGFAGGRLTENLDGSDTTDVFVNDY